MKRPGGEREQHPTDLQALDLVLTVARERLVSAPPRFHGVHEYRSRRETISHEVWVEWPAFRLSLTGELNEGPVHERPPLIVATLDGKRFGVSDPGSNETYMTRSFGEAPWVLGPILNLFTDVMQCMSEEVLGEERILGRVAIRVRCTEALDVDGGFDTWVDRQTGLVLRQILLDPDQEPRWSGFVQIEFDPDIDPRLLDPAILVNHAA
jgi:hypothetical protein